MGILSRGHKKRKPFICPKCLEDDDARPLNVWGRIGWHCNHCGAEGEYNWRGRPVI